MIKLIAFTRPDSKLSCTFATLLFYCDLCTLSLTMCHSKCDKLTPEHCAAAFLNSNYNNSKEIQLEYISCRGTGHILCSSLLYIKPFVISCQHPNDLRFIISALGDLPAHNQHYHPTYTEFPSIHIINSKKLHIVPLDTRAQGHTGERDNEPYS